MHKTRSNILEELSKNCRISTTELAKRVKQPRHVVAYHKGKLMKDTIINHEILLNYNTLGYSEYIVYLRMLNFSKVKDEMCEDISKNNKVRWLVAVFPHFNLRIVLVVKDHSEVEEFMNDLEDKYSSNIVDKEIIVCKEYLKRESYATQSLVEDVKDKSVVLKLNDSDKKLVTLLGNNPVASLVELASEVDCSIETVRQKIKKFQETGLIECFSAKHEATKVGHHFWANLLLKVKKMNQNYPRLKSLVYSHVKFGRTRKTFGGWNVEMTVFGKSYSDFSKTVTELEHFFGDDMEGYKLIVFTESFVHRRLPPAIFGHDDSGICEQRYISN